MKIVSTLVLVLLLDLSAVAGKLHASRDPLNPQEVDQIRDTTEEPNKRLKLFVQFARARMLAIQQLRADPKLAEGRGKQIHSLLEDFTAITEDLEDNIEMFDKHREDMRKSLKEVVEAYSEWQLKLRELKAVGDDPSQREEYKQYEFVLDSAIDSINEGADSARDKLAYQQAHADEYKKSRGGPSSPR